MSLSLMKASALRAGVKPAAPCRQMRVKAGEVPPNVNEARQWINGWQQKQMARTNRPSWLPGSQLPTYLDGTLPADYGFDPLALGSNSESLKWYVQAELVHSRFAMLGVAGVLFPELLASAGLGGPAAQVEWFNAGKQEYFAPASSLFIVQMVLFAWVELRRLQDYNKPGSANQDPIFTSNKLPDGNEPGYPGGVFDPLGFTKGDIKELKVKELKNGRLAMLAFLGFVVQWKTTGMTPLQGLSQHLADPWNTTVINNELSRLIQQ